MPKNRIIPFGYCMRNGEITVDFNETKAVVRIFKRQQFTADSKAYGIRKNQVQ